MRIAVAPELKGRKPGKASRTFPRMLRQCIGLDGVRRWYVGNASYNLSGTAGKLQARLKGKTLRRLFVFSKEKERMDKYGRKFNNRS